MSEYKWWCPKDDFDVVDWFNKTFKEGLDSYIEEARCQVSTCSLERPDGSDSVKITISIFDGGSAGEVFDRDFPFEPMLLKWIAGYRDPSEIVEMRRVLQNTLSKLDELG